MNIVIGEFSWKKLKWLADVTVPLQVRDYKKTNSKLKKTSLTVWQEYV